VVGPLPAATVVDVLSSDIEHTVVPREIDFFPVEPGELNCEDELVVFLVQFVVGTGRVVEESGQKPDPLEPGAVGSVGSDTADHLGSSRSLVVFRYEYRLLLLFYQQASPVDCWRGAPFHFVYHHKLYRWPVCSTDSGETRGSVSPRHWRYCLYCRL
jgi:hypothetical protein